MPGTLALHVAVDAHDLTRDERGIGTYLRAVLSQFAARGDVRLTLVVRDPFPLLRAGALRASIGAPRAAVAGRVPRDAAVVWHPWNGTFVTTDRPAVATIHDLAPFAFPAPDAARRESQQAPFRRSAQHARLILCDSAFTAGEAARALEVSRERLRVVPLGVDRSFAPGPLDALPAALRHRPFVLHVGAHDAHKNVATLAAGMHRAFPHGELALAFTRPAPGVPEAIVCERVGQATLLALYRAATIVAVPSLYEGFGLPLLEAMACGTAVLASRAASLPEVGGDSVRYVDEPSEPEAWAHALRALAADDGARAALAASGRERAAFFTWERCAGETLAVLREAAA
jgi:glycosyltransferase involved in cell wall biosynthesis